MIRSTVSTSVLDFQQVLPHGVFLATRQIVQQSILSVVRHQFSRRAAAIASPLNAFTTSSAVGFMQSAFPSTGPISTRLLRSFAELDL